MASILDFGTVNVGNVDRLRTTIKKDGVAWNLSTADVTFRFRNPIDGTEFDRIANIESAVAGIAYYDTVVTDLLDAGTWHVTVIVVDGAVTKTYPNKVILRVKDQPEGG